MPFIAATGVPDSDGDGVEDTEALAFISVSNLYSFTVFSVLVSFVCSDETGNRIKDTDTDVWLLLTSISKLELHIWIVIQICVSRPQESSHFQIVFSR